MDLMNLPSGRSGEAAAAGAAAARGPSARGHAATAPQKFSRGMSPGGPPSTRPAPVSESRPGEPREDGAMRKGRRPKPRPRGARQGRRQGPGRGKERASGVAGRPAVAGDGTSPEAVASEREGAVSACARAQAAESRGDPAERPPGAIWVSNNSGGRGGGGKSATKLRPGRQQAGTKMRLC